MLTAVQLSILIMHINKVTFLWHYQHLKHTKRFKIIVTKTIKQTKVHKWLNNKMTNELNK